ncbi:MAG: zinc ribbon domain-containing protein [Anaerolineae bacterium]|nr:zinc ribbon domain-containing protein [Anaerolineae bacterium]
MPIYVYQCDTCGMTFETRQTFSEKPLRDCPECDGNVRRVVQPVGVVFKGSGFYVTDHRARSSTAAPAKSAEKHTPANGKSSTSNSNQD